MAKLKRKLKTDIVEGMCEEEELNFSTVLSTHSTLLDLAISGNRTKYGGIPGGIILEVFGPSSSGKTAILAEISSESQSKGGEVMFCDTEARLDREYSRIYGLNLKEENYHRPDTVEELFDSILNWEPRNPSAINVVAADSLAALTTDLEMSDGGDKYGMKRAKDFSTGLRKTCRKITKENWLIVCSNQERDSPSGSVTPGGRGVPYYASVRIRMFPAYPSLKITKDRTIMNKKITKTIGIKSTCEIKKSSIDDPFRRVPISIIFGYGIDDIRDQLQWTKEITGDKFDAITKSYATIDKAIQHIEDNDLEAELKEKTVMLWNEIEEAFKVKRKKRQ